MGWERYNLDRQAHDLVLKYCNQNGAANQAHKMRVTVAYGLERFWGEQFRLVKEPIKASYWRDTWQKLVEIMDQAGIKLPNETVKSDDQVAIKAIADRLWDFPLEQRKVTLAILTELCDCMVWWTQRYKPSKGATEDE